METTLKAQQITITHIKNFVVNTNKVGKEKITLEYLKVRITLLEQYWSKFQNNHEQLIKIATPDDISNEYFENDTFSDVELAYSENRGILNKMLHSFEPPNPPGVLNQTTITESSPAIHALPKIQLTRFGGDLREWSAFHDLFQSLIDSRSDLTGSQKLYYLKTNLYGQAEQLLRNIVITDANYASAWKILCDRFQNKRVLVSIYLKMLNSLPSMRTESADELRKIYDGTIEATKALECLGRPIKHWDDWLIFVITQKLDASTRKDWEDSINPSNEPPTFNALCTFLHNRIHTLEAVTISSTRPRDSHRGSTFINKAKTHSFKAHLGTTSEKCASCLGNHLLLFCPSFRQKSVQQRWEYVNKKQLCLNCLRSQHETMNCPSTNRCKFCKEMHHSMLHLNQNSSVSDQSFKPPLGINKVTATSSSTSMQALTTNIFSTVLLATARVNILSSNGRKHTVRALLDQGSQATFISSSVANLLHLPKVKVNVPISGIGSREAVVAKSTVEITIQSCINPDFQLKSVALVLPKLTKLSASSKFDLINCYHLQGLQLADPDLTDDSPIELIIGADNYFTIIKEGIRHGTPMAQNTSLGWILSGPVHHSSSENRSRIKQPLIPIFPN